MSVFYVSILQSSTVCTYKDEVEFVVPIIQSLPNLSADCPSLFSTYTRKEIRATSQKEDIVKG